MANDSSSLCTSKTRRSRVIALSKRATSKILMRALISSICPQRKTRPPCSILQTPKERYSDLCTPKRSANASKVKERSCSFKKLSRKHKFLVELLHLANKFVEHHC